jgi:nitrogen fixation NifU-like protein
VARLEDLYREIILDHYRNPRNRGELEVPPAVQAVGFNPLCGDEVVVYVEVSDGVITDVSTGGQGCSISQSSASMMSMAVKGRRVAEARRLVRAFKHMMSIHGTGIGGRGDDLDHDDDSGNGADDVRLGDLEALQGVVKFPVRIKCATLSWNTLVEALDETFA